MNKPRSLIVPRRMIEELAAGLRARFPGRDWTLTDAATGDGEDRTPYVQAETRIGHALYRARFELTPRKLEVAQRMAEEGKPFDDFVAGFVAWVARHVADVEREQARKGDPLAAVVASPGATLLDEGGSDAE